MNTGVFDRRGMDVLSKNLYVLNFSMFTSLGIFISFLIARYSLNYDIGWVEVIVVLVLGILGVIINVKSDVPVISLFGYMLVAVPYGFLLGPFINDLAGPLAEQYLGIPISTNIATAFLVTTAYVVVFGVIGAIIPNSLSNWRGWICYLLLAAIVGYIIVPFFSSLFGLSIETALNFWDSLIVLLFAAIIIFDFNRAMRIPYTTDNAIDVALSIYLDWMNVFVRVARLLKKR